MNVKTWLHKKFIEWEMEEGERKSISEFAAWLDISQPVLSNYLNGNRRPTGENVHKLAERLGPEIYDILKIERPNPVISFISKNWDRLPPGVQNLILGEIEKEILKQDETGRETKKANY